MNEGMDELLEELAECIDTCRQRVEAGQEPSLAALPDLAARLYAAVEALPREQRAAAAECMGEVAESLASLEAEMRAKQGEVAEELKNLAQLRKAHLAYLTAPSKGNLTILPEGNA